MRFLYSLLLLTGTICYGQEQKIQKIADDVSIEQLRKNLYYLASDQMEGRAMGSHGDTMASLYISDWFKANNLTAPYQNGTSYFQAVDAFKKNLKDAELKIGD